MKKALTMHPPKQESWMQHAWKVLVGIVYYCGLELLFIGIAVGAIWLILHTVNQALNATDHPSAVFADENFRNLAAAYGGWKKRKSIRKWLEKNKIFLR